MKLASPLLGIRSTTRIAITLGCISASVTWCALAIGLFPDVEKNQSQNRVRVAEAIAYSVGSQLTDSQGDQTDGQLEDYFESLVERDSEIEFVCLYQAESNQVISAPVVRAPQELATRESNTEFMKISLSQGETDWMLMFGFSPLRTATGLSWLYPFTAVCFCGCVAILFFWGYLTRVLKHLNPNKVVPNRVRTALDSLAEGLLLLNSKEEIVLANESFTELFGRSADQLTGLNPRSFEWVKENDQAFPWTKCLQEKDAVKGRVLSLTIDEDTRRFIVNATPILSETNQCSGVLVSLDDITALENKKDELSSMLQLLKNSRDKVQKQNRELHVLASIDPMTECLNRRSFFEAYRIEWQEENSDQMNILMVDIDKFKSINDRYGHLIGDEVICEVARKLRSVVGTSGLVCRYGGEEFCILLTNCDLETCLVKAEEIRAAIESETISNVAVTVSVGASNKSLKAMDPQHLIDQADQSLYVAKRQGRNRVVSFENVDAEDTKQVEAVQVDSPNTDINDQNSVTTSLLSALALRDRATAEHCHRVASLVLTIANGITDSSLRNELETAALLHDIGKIGVPDSIIFKPGKLTASEFETMKKFEATGADIARSALSNEVIPAVIAACRVAFGDGLVMVRNGEMEEEIFKMGQIVRVCNVYDSMTNHQVFRPAMHSTRAINHLMKNANTEYDPTVVAKLISVISDQSQVAGNSSVAKPASDSPLQVCQTS